MQITRLIHTLWKVAGPVWEVWLEEKRSDAPQEGEVLLKRIGHASEDSRHTERHSAGGDSQGVVEL